MRAEVYKRDQYDRIVATVYVRKGLLRRNVGLEMLKAGLATVYEAKSGAEFGDLESRYREAEGKARAKRLGIWSLDPKEFESPREYKKRTNAVDETTPASAKGFLGKLFSSWSGKS